MTGFDQRTGAGMDLCLYLLDVAWYDKFYLTINVLLPDVDKDEKDDPDHIDEVPEQAHRAPPISPLS